MVKVVNKVFLWPKGVLLALIMVYQKVFSPIMGRQCRFSPTCSHYAQESIMTYGAAKGSIMALKRILRCHPWGGPGGIDPVP
jgi:uncharacterized protein